MEDILVKCNDHPIHLPPKSLNMDIVHASSCYEAALIITSILNHKPCNFNIFNAMVSSHT